MKTKFLLFVASIAFSSIAYSSKKKTRACDENLDPQAKVHLNFSFPWKMTTIQRNDVFQGNQRHVIIDSEDFESESPDRNLESITSREIYED